MRLLLLTAALLGSGWLASTPAKAETANPFAGAERLSEEELDDNRGGLVVADGFTIGFGAVVRTVVDGQVVLETRLDWTDAGPVTSTTGSAVAMSADTMTALTDTLAAAGVRVVGLSDQVEMVERGTAVLHSIDGGQIINGVINTADDISIRQEVELSLFLPGFDLDQQAMITALTGLRLQDDMDTGSIGALGR